MNGHKLGAAVIAGVASLAFALTGCGGGNTTSVPNDATTSNAPSTTPATPAPSASASPAATFADGTFVVGKDIQAGTYHTAGAAKDGVDCYWETDRDTTGQTAGVIHNHASRDGQNVTITPDVAQLRTVGCQSWSLVPPTGK